MRFAFACALTLILVAAARPAQADDEDEARAAMRRGLSALTEGDAQGALAEFETAKRLAPRANAPFFHAAEALSKLGRYREAVRELETYLAKDPGVSDAADVRARIAKLRADHFPGRVRVTSNVDHARVRVDDGPDVPLGELELAPGPHRVQVSAPGYSPDEREVVVTGDQDTTVSFALAANPAAPPPSTSPAPPPEPESRTPSPWRTVGFVTAGAGALTLAATLVADAAALGPKIADYRDAADRGEESARELHGDVESLRTGVVVGYVAGGALLIGGLALALFAPRPSLVAKLPRATFEF